MSRVKPDVTLADQNTGVVDRLGKSLLEHLSLETALKEILHLQTEHVIELHLVISEHTNAHQAAKKRITLEQSASVLQAKSQSISIHNK